MKNSVHFSLALTEHEIKNNALLDKEELTACRKALVLNYQMFYLKPHHLEQEAQKNMFPPDHVDVMVYIR